MVIRQQDVRIDVAGVDAKIGPRPLEGFVVQVPRALSIAFPVVGAREAADDAVFSRSQRLCFLERLNCRVEAAHAEQRDAEI